MTHELSKEKIQWLHDACEEAAAAGIKLTMNPNELLMFTSALLAAHEQEPSATLFKSGDSAKVIMIGSDLPDGYTDVFSHPAPISAAAMPVAVVELSDYVTASGDEPRKKAVKELYEGALVVGQNLYTHPAPSIPEAGYDNIKAIESAISALKTTIKDARRFRYCLGALMNLDDEVAKLKAKASVSSPSIPAAVPEGYCMMPLKLSAENGAKGALSGEFHVTHRIVCQSCGGEGCEDCNEEGGWDGEILIGWDIIKQIHEAAVEACALPAAPKV